MPTDQKKAEEANYTESSAAYVIFPQTKQNTFPPTPPSPVQPQSPSSENMAPPSFGFRRMNAQVTLHSLSSEFPPIGESR